MDIKPSDLIDVFSQQPLGVLGDVPDESLQLCVSKIFGVSLDAVSVKEMVYCAGLGSWVNGWTVLLKMADDTYYGLVVKNDMYETLWDGKNKWFKYEILSESIKSTSVFGTDLSNLALNVTKLESNEYLSKASFPDYNSNSYLWLLSHIYSELESTDNFLVSTFLSDPDSEVLHRIESISHIRNNFVFVKDDANGDFLENGIRDDFKKVTI